MPAFDCPFDVCILFSLVTTLTQKYHALAVYCVVNPVARTLVSFKLPDTFANRLAITEVAILKSH